MPFARISCASVTIAAKGVAIVRYTFAVVAAAGTVALLAACMQQPNAVLPSNNAQLYRALPELSPPHCTGQVGTKAYAYVTKTVSIKGGSLCVPVFGGFGGAVTYGPASRSVKVKLITSTTNYNQKLPKLGTGTPLLYEQAVFFAAANFGKTVKQGRFVGSKIVPGKAYTLFAQVAANGRKQNFAPCYAVAVKGTYGGVFNIGPGLTDISIPSNATLVGEVYAGKRTNSTCS